MRKWINFLTVTCAFFVPMLGICAPIGNPRGGTSPDSVGTVSGRGGGASTRSASVNVRSTIVPAPNKIGVRAAKNVITRNSTEQRQTRSATVGRSPITQSSTVARTARTGATTSPKPGAVARSATTARATAIFNDVSKIGSGYAGCRESYATCMDQLCANANDTYRRCFCSNRFTNFRTAEDSLDRAMILLQNFQDNNLEVVDKSAAEVKAMYSPTVGELAVKKDTSAAAKALDAINDLLSGKNNNVTNNNSTSLGILNFDFADSFDDIWSGDASSIFSSDGQDLSTLEGTALFNAAQKQCSRLSQNSCENDAVFSMAKSSYNILINQDCNIYEKSLNKKKETVAQAVRTAEKYLREARLEEYRSHNSADVNECIGKVRTAILADTACGENYKRCLDPTGAYINGATGEPLYSPRLFELEYTMSLAGVTHEGDGPSGMNTDILGQNAAFNKFLDGYRKYVERELDTCRDISEFVWTEFKRTALIEIAQAQSAKIEEVKLSCVDTVANCYDIQSQSLVNYDKNTATAAGALGRYAARDMCREKVVACAALFGHNGAKQCEFDARGHLDKSSLTTCGIQSLINYVQTVDSLSAVEKCYAAVQEYLENLCTPDDSLHSYPYKCKEMYPGSSSNTDPKNMNLQLVVRNYAIQNCWDAYSIKGEKPGVGDWDKVSTNFERMDTTLQNRIDGAIADAERAIRASLASECNRLGGDWYDAAQQNSATTLDSFTNNVFGGNSNAAGRWGYCYKNDSRSTCLRYNSIYESGVATWDNNECIFSNKWYEYRCADIGGTWSNNVCTISNE